VDMNLQARGGVEGVEAMPEPAARKIWLLQRKPSKVGNGLGKTTGWAHRLGLQKRQVEMLSGCEYLRIDDAGLSLRVKGEECLLEVDNVVLCAGQESLQELTEGLDKPYHLIGGADLATELDAKRAIDQGTRLALII